MLTRADISQRCIHILSTTTCRAKSNTTLNVLELPVLPKCWRRSTKPSSVRISPTCWLWGLWAWMLELRSPNTMVSWSQKRVRASTKSCRCSRAEIGKYYLMVWDRLPVTTSQLTMFGPWNLIKSMIQHWGQSRTIMSNPHAHCCPPLWSPASTPHRIPSCCDNNPGQ